MFSDTPVPDLFIHDVMPKLSGNAVKCYLFLNSVSHNGSRDATRADLADRLGISAEAVDQALLELQGQQLITVGAQDIDLVDLKMQELSRRYRPITSSAPSEIRAREAVSEEREKMVTLIKMTFFQGIMTYMWYDQIDRWFEAYGFEPEVVYALFQEAANNNRLDGTGYASRIAEDWAAAGVKTYDQLSVYYSRFLEKNRIKAHVGKTLRRSLTEYDLKDIESWIDEYGYGRDIIDEALSKTRGATKPTIRFVSAVLKGWYEAGLKTLEEVQEYEKKRQADLSRSRKPAQADNRYFLDPEEQKALDQDFEYDIRMPRVDEAADS
ncbi:MAG: DnaD domain protein [Clostridiaceae bacterium]|jgi:DnaD/phage-associated family protein|nr:DnaD domain protein [Clostridiaceae bacterium]